VCVFMTSRICVRVCSFVACVTEKVNQIIVPMKVHTTRLQVLPFP
jgi:hypothetical protein